MQLSSRSTNSLAFVIILLSVIIAYSSVWNDSIIIDEDPHIGAGYSYLVKQDMRLNPEHPPLVKDIAALPLLFLNINQSAFESNNWISDVNGQWEFGRKLIFATGNNAQLITRLAKIPVLAFFILTALLIFVWTKKRYGNRAGLLALFLWSFSPTVIAHARFVTTDIAASFGVILASYFFLAYLKNPSQKTFWIAAVTFGIALITKFSTILLIPFFILLTLFWHWKFLARTIMIFLVGFILIVWPVYAFHVWHYPIARQQSDTADLLRSFGNKQLSAPVIWASGKPLLRAPAQYALGLLMVTQRSSGGNTVYFNGNTTDSAGPLYFPFVYLIKEPLPWLFLLLLAILFSLWKFKFKNSLKIENLKLKIDEIAMLLWLTIYWLTSIQSSLNIGVRHLLPVYPFMIILVAGQIENLNLKAQNYSSKFKNFRLSRRRFGFFGQAFFILIFSLLVWQVGENLRVYPYYLTYFNQLVGGPTGGYRYVVDSNLDWGQDLKRFADWVKVNNIKHIEFNYFGWADQAYYLGDSFIWLNEDKYNNLNDFKKRNTSDGWLAISATFLQNESKGKYKWLAEMKPVAVIGNSIFVYRVL